MAERYEIREEIGKGGLGAVFRAFDTQLQRDVAMKRVLTTEHGSQEEVQKAADNLLAEAQTLSTLNHPNIVTVFDVGQDEKGGFVVMELLNGETIDDTIARGVLTQEDFVEVVTQTMEALIAAQAANVLHRDLKPTNVMVIWQPSGKFQTKILDFGLAKLTKTPSVQTMDQDDAVMGSIYFMAPEQFERGELDERTDMYAIGCVYYYALTGQYPFRGETAPQVMNAHLQHRVTSLEKMRPDLSPSICQWVMWLINRKMENRPANAREALERFPKSPEPPGAAREEVLQAIPVEEAPPGQTTGVQVVAAPTSGAAPPTGMVITHHPDGSVSQRLMTDEERSGRQRTAPPPASNKAMKIVLAVCFVVLIALVGVIVSRKLSSSREIARLATLASQETPVGTVDDIDLAMKYLTGDFTPDQKANAQDILINLGGDNQKLEDALVERLRTATTGSARVTLSQSLARREVDSAVPIMLDAVASASGETEKKLILSEIYGLATEEHAAALLDSLGGQHSDDVRGLFENIILAIYARRPRSAEVVGPLLTRASEVEGEERQSLFEILGRLGGDAVLTRLKGTFSSGDLADQYQAMTGLLNWQDRAVVPILEGIIEEDKDKPLTTAAIRALCRVLAQPAPGKPADLVASWRKALELAERAEDIQRIMWAIADTPMPETKQLLTDLADAPKAGRFVPQTRELLADFESKAKNLNPGDLLSAAGTDQVRGNYGGVGFDEAVPAFENWRLPETWFSFHFRVAEAGTYDVQVLQSYASEGASNFQVIIRDKAKQTRSEATSDWQEYKPVTVDLGIQLQPGQVYTLHLRAKGVTQPRMMNIRGIKLIKR